MRPAVPLLVTLLFAAASAGAAERLTVPYEMFRLPNGLTVIVHEDHSAPIVSVNCWYHVGSGRETPGRTGFAHLFEHLMFEGSKNVPGGRFRPLARGGGRRQQRLTTNDRTNYWENAPANALEMPLFLESDRMGFLLDAMTPEKVDGQRDVVKNERRQGVENQPYGRVRDPLPPALFPKDHPYSWPVIGSMDGPLRRKLPGRRGLLQDLVRAGERQPRHRRRRGRAVRSADSRRSGSPTCRRASRSSPIVPRPVVLRGGEAPRARGQGPAAPPLPGLADSARLRAGDAALDAVAGVLAAGKNSRLYKRLVYDLQLAQDVAAFQGSSALASTFLIEVTARAGRGLEEILRLVDEEIARLRRAPPDGARAGRFHNQIEAAFFDRLERVGGFGGKATSSTPTTSAPGNPDYFEEDLARYRALTPNDVQAAACRFLGPGRVLGLVVPEGKKHLAVPEVTPMNARNFTRLAALAALAASAPPWPRPTAATRRSPARCARSGCRRSSGSRSRTACASCSSPCTRCRSSRCSSSFAPVPRPTPPGARGSPA